MKKLFTTLFIAATLVGCSYDDSDLWGKVDDLDTRVKALERLVSQLNTDISSMEKIVYAMGKDKSIADVTETNDGWMISFTDGTAIKVRHGANGTQGEDGTDGKDAPVIGIGEKDGIYYWTITVDGVTRWLENTDGNPIPVSGQDGTDGGNGVDGSDGTDGADGATPILGVDDEGYWTVNYGEGEERILDTNGNPIKAATDGVDSFFKEVIDHQSYVEFVLADGTSFNVAKIVPVVIGIDSDDEEYFQYGQQRKFKLSLTGVRENQLATNNPNMWGSDFNWADSTLTVTAPPAAAITIGAATEGVVTITAIGDDGMKMLNLPVRADKYELRTLTFEDEDYKGAESSPYWTSLIDSPQYGGPLLYDMINYGDVDYHWYDEGNTYLAHEFPDSGYGKAYWSGGHAVSNYIERDIRNGDSLHQLSVYHQDGETGYGGHNGSKNFCVHYGYDDGSGWYGGSLPYIYFGDGIARVIDHMYVTTTTYLINCVSNGNGLTEPVGPDGFVRVVAIGYNEEGNTITDVSPKFELANYDRTVIDWQKWDLSGLGKVLMIEFNVEGDSDNGYGFSQPAYFAYDDVAVRVE